MKTKKFTEQDLLTRVNIYGRINNNNPAAPMGLEVRNLQFGEAVISETEKAGVLTPSAVVKDGVISRDIRENTRFCEIALRQDAPYKKNRKLVFEYRVKDPEKLNYVAAAFSPDGKRWTFDQVKPAGEWTTGTVSFRKMYYTGRQGHPAEGEVFKKLRIYGRIDDKKPAEPMKLEIRNIRVLDDEALPPQAELRKFHTVYPLFDWNPQKGASGYELEYAGKRIQVRDAFFVPEEPVKPGVVKYTVRALPSREVIERHALYVAERNIDWKRPEYDWKAFVAKPRPRFRDRVALEQPDAAAYAASVRWRIGKPIPEDGKDFKPGADPRIKTRIDWKRIVSGMVNQTASHLYQIGTAAILTGDAAFVADAKRLALAIATQWDAEKGASSALLWDTDLSAARLLRGLCRCFDAAYNVMTPEERETVAANIRLRGDQFWKPKFPFRKLIWNNHAWDNVDGFVVAALTLAEEPGMEMRVRYAADLYASTFLPEMGFEGENFEGLEYWAFGLSLLINYVNDMKYTVGLDFYQQPWLRQTARFPMYGMPPYGYPVSFSDNHIQMGAANHSSAGPMDRMFTGKLAAESGDGIALWYAGFPERKGVKAQFPATVPQSRYYAHIGETFFNTFLADGRENVALGFHSGTCFAGHQHADQNSFTINAYGDKLAIDGGYYDWFGSPHFRAYSTQTMAHNTILVDGEGQPVRKRGADGRTTVFFDAPGFGAVSGDAVKAYPGKLTQFDRDIVFVKPDYIFVFDRLAAEKPVRFDWLIHAHTNDPVPVTGTRFHIRRPRAELSGTMLLPEKNTGKCVKSYDVKPAFYYSSDPAPRIQPEWTVMYSPEKKAKTAEFLAALQIGKPGMRDTDWVWNDSPDAVLVTGNGVKVLFNRNPGRIVRLGGFETDARYAAVVEQNGKIFDLMKCGGKVFRYQGTAYGEPGKDFALRKRNDSTRPGQLVLDGKKLPATLHCYEFAFGRKVYALECVAELPENTVLDIAANVPGHWMTAHAERHWGEAVRPGSSLLFPVLKGKNIFSFTSSEDPGEVRLSSVKAAPVSAQLIGKDWQSPAGAIPVEAECPEQESQPRNNASRLPEGGYAYGNWRTSGRFSEWEVTAPAAGEYRLYIRYATPEQPVETFRINDGMIPAGHAVQLPSTGSWTDFRWCVSPQKVPLKQGRNVLKMIAVSGMLNIDKFVLVKE
ncbi:MAG: DUF4962 domain-containing protein [Lentisphaeria bacterium]|nr:DUF4962 domain-containing protein [Lentisphaeria bacterium]